MTPDTPLDIALELIARGIVPIPIPVGEKCPVILNWPAFEVTPETASKHFNGQAQNIGMLLGPRSGGVVDIDLDQSIAVELAPSFLKPTECIYGRASNLSSHRIYRCKDRWTHVTFSDSEVVADTKAMIVELRGEDHQSLAPGSTHPSGERYAWEKDGPPCEIPYEELLDQVRALAAACVLSRYWIEGQHNNLNVALAGTLLRAGWSRERVEQFVKPIMEAKGDPKGQERFDRIESLAAKLQSGGGRGVPGLPKLRQILGATATAKVAEWLRLDANQIPREEHVTYRAGGLPEAVDETLAVLPRHAAALNLYGSGGALVRPHLASREGFRDAAGVPQKVESLELARVSLSGFRVDLTRIIEYTTERRVKGLETAKVRTDCPIDVARAIFESPNSLGTLPQIHRVAEVPLFDGLRLVHTSGLHEGTWVHAPADVALPAELSLDCAREALARLEGWISEFPFAKALDRAVALALLMTAALRPSLDAAPGFLVNKPSYGAGATTLAKLAGIVATGRMPPVMPFVDKAESTKHLVAALLAGRHVLIPDNLPEGSELSNELLAQVLSEPQAVVRELGRSVDYAVDCRRLVVATGVGVSVGNDLMRRMLSCRLDPKIERPFDREFRRPDVLRDVQNARTEVLRDLYTLVAAYRAQPASVPVMALAGYSTWTHWVAAPLHWLGLPDVVQAAREASKSDPVSACLRQVLDLVAKMQEWPQFRRAGGVSTKEMTQHSEHNDDKLYKLRSQLCGVLGEATAARTFNDEPQLNPVHVGRWFKRVEERVIDGRRLVIARHRTGVAVWRVETVPGDTP